MTAARILLIGLGDLGLRIVRELLSRGDAVLKGIVDIDPEKVGRDVGELAGLPTLGCRVAANPGQLLQAGGVDIAIHATFSHLEKVADQLTNLLSAGVDVISTCEELSYPFHRHAQLAERIDRAAAQAGATVLGTGINPGFLMDALPLVLTTPCLRVDAIDVTRRMNSADRRRSYQAKIGTGLTPEEFRQRVESGRLTGHVGLFESATMIADALGWRFDRVEEPPPRPIIARQRARTRHFTVEPGQVAGLMSTISLWEGDVRRVHLRFISSCEVARPYDGILIHGNPTVRQRISAGVPGDAGTVAMVLNLIHTVRRAPPGLMTMLDIIPHHHCGGGGGVRQAIQGAV